MKLCNMVIKSVNHCLLYTHLFNVAHLERNLPNLQALFSCRTYHAGVCYNETIQNEGKSTRIANKCCA